MPTDPSKSNKPVLLKGRLLLADPSLRDGMFDRSVILLTDHTHDDGATGLILNHPIGKTVGDLLNDEKFSSLKHLAVHTGGPVSREQLTFSSFWWSRKSGLRWSIRISAEEASDHVRQPGRVVRAFVGYSGWSAGQLETELRRKSWFTATPKSGLLGQSHDKALWSNLLGSMSPLHHILSKTPEDPFLN